MVIPTILMPVSFEMWKSDFSVQDLYPKKVYKQYQTMHDQRVEHLTMRLHKPYHSVRA